MLEDNEERLGRVGCPLRSAARGEDCSVPKQQSTTMRSTTGQQQSSPYHHVEVHSVNV